MDTGCFCPVAISLPHGNTFCDFLWEATHPRHIIAFAGAESIATQSSLWGREGTHRSAVVRVQHPPTHSNEIKPDQGWNPTGRDIFLFLLELLRKRLCLSTGLAKALDWKQREAGIHLGTNKVKPAREWKAKFRNMTANLKWSLSVVSGNSQYIFRAIYSLILWEVHLKSSPCSPSFVCSPHHPLASDGTTFYFSEKIKAVRERHPVFH